MPRKLQAAVIGSGFGGLSVAIRLQALGIDTTLYEKRDRPGGRAYVYQQDGFTFDAGPTVITAPEVIRELFEVAGRRAEDYVDLLPVDPFYRLLWEDGKSFDYTNDEAELTRQITAFAPEDVDGYRRFFEYSGAVYEKGYTQLAHVPFLRIRDMVAVAPHLLKLKAYRTVYEMVSRYIKSPHLRQAFSFHSLLIGGSPFEASSIYTLIHYLERKGGVFFPRGGTGALVQGMVKLFEDIGGKLVLNAEIDRVVVAGGSVGGVALKDQGTLPYDLVVSNADVHETYHQLLRGVPRARRMRRFTERASYSMSLFLIYFGTRKQYPELAHHSILFGPRYRDLIDDIFKRGTLAEDFSLYLHSPTRTDPALAPAGHDAFYVLSPVPNLGKLRVDWKVEGERYADRILDYLERRLMPGLRANLVTKRVFTPLDFKTELNAHLGSAFSLAPTLTQSAYFRAHNRDRKIGGLYFCGAGTHPGAGVPGVIQSAKATAAVIQSDFRTELAKSVRPDLTWAPA